jgi:hypothetical protein
MRWTLRLLLIGMLLPAACAAPVTQEQAGAAPTAAAAARAAAESITAQRTLAHVAYLASDELRGRDTPSPGLEMAARYIEARFREWGVQPAGDDGTYVQRWPYRSLRFDRATLGLELRGAQGTVRPEFGTGFFLASGPTEQVEGEIWFAGRSGAQPRPLPTEARGRVVSFYVPGAVGAEWQVPVVAALQSAMQAGAAGLLLVLDPAIEAADVGQLADGLESQQGLPMTIVGVRYDIARDFFRAAGLDLDAVRERTAGFDRVAGASMHTSATYRPQESTPPNVIGVVEGSDPNLRNEFVVFSAHFDHVGVGAPDATGDSIYNGADDNASGTSAVLELARAFASAPTRPARSMMFVLVSGEEKGLLGSAYFADNPTVPITSIVANVNMDMVGRNAPDSVVAIGQDYSSLGPLVQRINAAHPELGLTVAPDLWPEERLFFRSDHFSFARREVPAIFFTTGLHDDYHRPSDTAEKIDADKIARIARLAYHLGTAVGNAPERPQWTEQGLRDVRAMTGGQ